MPCGGRPLFNIVSVALGLAFLYLPIAILVIYSFNASRLVTVWGGWSLALVSRAAERHAPCSMPPGSACASRALSATAATVLGTLAALALVRMGRFRGRLLFSGMVYAPLVMPEVITGLSLLLLFVAVDARPRLLDHRRRAHHADHVLRHRDRAVAARSASTAAWRRRRWISAARRCGPSSPITLPLIAPAIAAGWMLAFALSLDDLVIASFTTGPGATTLPIRIYSEVRLGVKPEINAVCTIMIAVVALGDDRRFADCRKVGAAAARGPRYAAQIVKRAAVSAARFCGVRGRRVGRGWRWLGRRRRRPTAARSPSAPRRARCARARRRAAAPRRPSGGSGLGVRQHDRIVPRALHHKRQLEWPAPRRRATVSARGALEVEVARRDRGRAGEREPHRRAVDVHVLDAWRSPCVDLQLHGESCRTACGRCGIRRRRRAAAAPAGAAIARH